MRKLIYLAAPLFSQSERELNLRLANIMGHFCDVYLPQRDGMLLPDLICKRGMEPADAFEQVFNLDMAAVRRCDALVIVLDGRSIDEGAAFELGRAHGQATVCVGYHTDFRTLTPWGINPIIAAALSQTFRTELALGAWAQDFSLAKLTIEQQFKRGRV